MMLGKWTGFRAQPVAVAEFVRQVLFTLVMFDLIKWTTPQQNQVLQVVSLGLALLTYNSVTSQATLERAGSSQAATVAEAEKNKAIEAGVPPPSPPPKV